MLHYKNSLASSLSRRIRDNLPTIDLGTFCRIIFGKLSFTFGKWQGYQYLETLVLVLTKFGIGIYQYLASGIGIDQYLIAYNGIDQNTNNSLKIKGIVYHNLN